MFKRKDMGLAKTVVNCPHTRGTNGLVHMPEWLVAEICGAVEEPDEWAIVLKGRRLEGGRLVVIDDYTIPEQERSGGYVNIGEVEMTEDIVGVIHSHHSMGAFFSGTDTRQLNPRFPISIVVAQKANQYLGFSYKATGKFTLPCGAQGEQAFLIQPIKADGTVAGPVIASMTVEPDGTELGDCVNFSEVEGDAYQAGWEAECGIRETGLRAEAFGVGESLIQLIGIIPAVTYVPPPITKGGYSVTDRRGSWRLNEGRSSSWEEDKTSVYSADEQAADDWLQRQRDKSDARIRRKALGLPVDDEDGVTRFPAEEEGRVYVVDAAGNVTIEDENAAPFGADEHGYTSAEFLAGMID